MVNVQPTQVTVSCAVCARAFKISFADYTAEQERAEGASRGEPWGARRPWYCSMSCLNDRRERP